MKYRTGLSYPNPSPLTTEALLDGSEETLAFSINNLTFQSFVGLCQFLIGASSFPFFSFFVECAKAEQSLKYGMWLNPRPQCQEARALKLCYNRRDPLNITESCHTDPGIQS